MRIHVFKALIQKVLHPTIFLNLDLFDYKEILSSYPYRKHFVFVQGQSGETGSSYLLSCHEFCEKSVSPDELVIGSVLHDLSFIKDYYPVTVFDGGKPVGYYYPGTLKGV